MASNPGRSPRPARTSAKGRSGVSQGGDSTLQNGQTNSVIDGLTMTNTHTGAPGSAGGHGSSDVTTQNGQLGSSLPDGTGSNLFSTGAPGSAGNHAHGGGESVTYTDAFALQGYGNDSAQMTSPNATSGPNDSTTFSGNGFTGPSLPGLENNRLTDTGAGKGSGRVRHP